ncbi:polysaccharide deacetylase family protein [Pontibacter sp. G13]|uniref:polysaccharide deacetylase family protein n=1 Tax=Pontibacter sp. G13 TaxID=3074898 RepID=UPI00288A26F8|nr:polysaccharide deacetylase family protein [Pontibacter sp. G13]WNJ19772.1 polysaccharide deacetylase family protein [Pontibacter sp. G13]
MSKLVASLSLDLDDQWTYLKTHGDESWQSYPSYLNYAVPRILDFLDKHQTPITFFIVAQDAAFDHNHDVLREIAVRGHDIGNHTFHHDPWLHIYSAEEIHEELGRAEEHIERVTGVKPNGFRGPGFSFSDTVLKVLTERGYRYDASTFPNILNPLARAYFLATSNLSKEEREQRKGLFGSWSDGLRPNKPYQWNSNGTHLLEIPVTTMPMMKVPIHASYILYLGTFNYSLAISYLKFAINMCKMTRTEPSILLHPLDYLGCDDTEALSFFPAMRVKSDLKIRIMDEMFRLLNNHFDVRTMDGHADHIMSQGKLKAKLVPA